jgi:hypothetical protein
MTTSEQLLIKHLKKRLERRKRQSVRLPIDLTGHNGEFPEPNATQEERTEQIKFFTNYLADVLRPTFENRAKIVRRMMKEEHQRKQFFDFMVYGPPEENYTVSAIRRFMRERQGITEAIIFDTE